MSKTKTTGKKTKIKIEGWINIYQNESKVYSATVIHSNEAQARKQSGGGAVDCVFISQEVEVKTIEEEKPEPVPTVESPVQEIKDDPVAPNKQK